MNPLGLEAFRLPPLILHPFSSAEDTSVLVESSRASLTLQGFLPPAGSAEELDRKLLRGRFAELRMLYYIGKDLTRWIEQCVETIKAPNSPYSNQLLEAQTFAVYLVEYVPAHIRTKLEGWGVLDFCALFRRALGLHSVFQEIPVPDVFSADFLRRYHRHVDQWYELYLREKPFDRPTPGQFSFDLYASGEYTLMLEQTWAEIPPDAKA